MTLTDFHEYVLLGVDSLILSVLYAVYRRRETIIKYIADAPSVNVGPELHNVINENDGVLPYAVVRGRVTEVGQTIESSSGLKGVLQVVTMNEHSTRRHAFGHWGDNVRTLHKSQNSVPFALKSVSFDESSSGPLVDVETPFEASHDSLLLTVATHFTPSNSSVASTVMGFFTGVAVRGVEKTEEFLPVDTIVTGIGRIVRDSQGRVKLIPSEDETTNPYMLSTLPIESIIKRMESKNTILKVAMIACFSIGAFITVRRIHAWWKVRQARKMRENILRQRSKIDLQGLNAAQTCIICLTNPREVIILPCGHICACADCCLQVQSKSDKCPICRKRIIETHAAFIA